MKLLTCKEASRIVSQGLDRRFGFAERVSVRVHLAICGGCRAFSRQLGFLRTAVSRLPHAGGESDKP